MPGPFITQPGRRHPLGATVEDQGVNFSVYSRYATGAEILLYEDAWALEPFQVIALDPELNHTFFAWHILVVDLPPGTHYTWRMQGPYEPKAQGWRFDPEVELIDPWARAVNNCKWDRWERQREGVRPHDSPRAVVLADDYDWHGDQPLDLHSEAMIVYELHVGGFTRHPSSGVAHPGTFSGIIEKIPYLKNLGITHVELMPVMAFDEQDVPEQVWDAGLTNFWGYSTHSFFSPHPGYCVAPREGQHRVEFRDMVRALHKAGMGVIMDVVFNHTAEGGFGGPVLNLKGFANETFYCLDALDKTRHLDFTGCGNTVNANHPLVTRFIVDCLEYWVREMHVDGFRFDLASAMARDENGAPLHNPPVLWAIELSDVLARSKIIAEAWDAAGLYQVGSFPGYRWMEWNGRYRDSLRRFVRGDSGLISEMATRLSGSSDLYQHNLRQPINSINFATCHDGFSLADLVSYDDKHNEANREGNRDGTNDNLGWNCGAEGDTDQPEVLALRRQQVRNFMAILFISQGIPMILAGDEVLRSQAGNNNVWCQDNELGWFDWTLVERNADMLRFVRGLIALRRRHPSLQRRHFLSGRAREGTRLVDITWHGVDLDAPQWDDATCRVLAFTLAPRGQGAGPLHVMLNMGDETLDFAVPAIDAGPGGEAYRWHLAVDTGAVPPDDLCEPGQQPLFTQARRSLGPRSLVVLEGL